MLMIDSFNYDRLREKKKEIEVNEKEWNKNWVHMCYWILTVLALKHTLKHTQERIELKVNNIGSPNVVSFLDFTVKFEYTTQSRCLLWRKTSWENHHASYNFIWFTSISFLKRISNKSSLVYCFVWQ